MSGISLALLLTTLLTVLLTPSTQAQTIPPTQTNALDNHPVTLPQNLGTRATVLIIGFSKKSADNTTTWEKPVRTRLAQPPNIAFYDIAMLAEVPGFVRSFVLRSIRHQVPDVLKPNFLTLFNDEAAWKRASNYTPDQPDAAYILLVDPTGHILYTTHTPYTEAALADLTHRTHTLANGS